MGLLRLVFFALFLCAIAAAIFYCYKKRKITAPAAITEPLQSDSNYRQMGNPYETMRAAVPVQSFRAEPYFKV